MKRAILQSSPNRSRFIVTLEVHGKSTTKTVPLASKQLNFFKAGSGSSTRPGCLVRLFHYFANS